MNRARMAVLVVVAAAFVGGYFAGREHLKYQMRRSVADAVKAFSEGLGSGLGDESAPGDAREAAKDTVTAKGLADAYRPYLKLYDVRASYENDLLDGRVAVVRGKLKNNGNKTLSRVEVTAYFLDAAGNRIYEEDYTPVLAGDSFAIDSDMDKPLKSGYIRAFGFKATGCPKEWKPGAVECEISGIEAEGE